MVRGKRRPAHSRFRAWLMYVGKKGETVGWIHKDKHPKYLVPARPDAKPVEPHEVDAHVNAQGDWVCHKCGLLVQLNKERPPVNPPVLGRDQGPPVSES